MTDKIFEGLDKFQELSEKLKDITKLVIRPDNPDLEIKGRTLFAPPDMEVLLRALLEARA